MTPEQTSREIGKIELHTMESRTSVDIYTWHLSGLRPTFKCAWSRWLGKYSIKSFNGVLAYICSEMFSMREWNDEKCVSHSWCYFENQWMWRKTSIMLSARSSSQTTSKMGPMRNHYRTWLETMVSSAPTTFMLHWF